MARRHLLLVLGVTALAGGRPALAEEAPPRFTIQQVTANVFHLTSSVPDFAFMMNNLVVVGDDGAVLIDSADPGLYPSLKAALIKVTRQPIKLLINSHWHHDHTGLNQDFVQREGTVVIAHENVAGRLSSPQHLTDLEKHPLDGVGADFPKLPRQALPTIRVRGDLSLHLDGERIDLHFVPDAHSNSDLVVYLRTANIVYMGDLYFGGLFPFIDRASGGTIDGMIRACEEVAGSIDEKTRVIPSHGRSGTRADLYEYIRLLKSSRARIAALIQRGDSEEQALARRPFAELEKTWGWSFVPGDLFARLIYRSLRAHPDAPVSRSRPSPPPR